MSRITFHMDQGPRENLEDTCAATKVVNALEKGQEVVAAMVLDGVGGANYGEVASRLARKALTAELTALASLVICHDGKHVTSPEAVLGDLSKALTQSNDVILRESMTNSSLKGMATTAVCALVFREVLCLAWVGDSRCYLYRGHEIRQITRDHSESQELVELDVITPEEARNHPGSHTITRYLGQATGFRPETRTCRIWPGDVIILCTDGLSDVVTDAEISKHVEAYHVGLFDFDELPHRLVKHALSSGTQDNVTAVCCEYQCTHAPTALSGTLTEAYSVELAKTMQQLAQEVTHV
jgi:serine/threonine protein phosphatase PrpC